MTTRDRTTLFIQYRNSFGRGTGIRSAGGLLSNDSAIKNSSGFVETDRVGLLADRPGGNVTAIEMSQLPPRWLSADLCE
jgi:hypothetical protein